MPSADRLLAFAGLSLVLILVPGPSVLFVIGRALAQGRRAALLTVLGNTVGSYVLVLGVALGVGAVVERSVLVFTVLKWAGAAYLVYLGVKTWRARGVLHAPAVAAGGGDRRSFREGLLVGITNPKTIVFYAAVLPQFVDRDAGHAAGQMLLLGLIFNCIALACDSLWGITAGAARTWFADSPRRMSRVGGFGGLAMIGLGVSVAVTGRKD